MRIERKSKYYEEIVPLHDIEYHQGQIIAKILYLDMSLLLPFDQFL